MANNFQIAVGTNHPALLQWITDRIDVARGKDIFTTESTRCIALFDGIEIVAVVALDDWHETYCEASIASDGTKRWANRRFLQAIYGYVFDYLGLTRMNMVVDVSNEAAINMHNKLGHNLEGRLRDWYGEDRDAFIYGFTKRDWAKSKWNRRTGGKNG